MDKPSTNADGSTDIFIGPKPPGEGKNWLATVPGSGFFSILRLYGPTQPFFDRTWKPGDLEKMNSKAVLCRGAAGSSLAQRETDEFPALAGTPQFGRLIPAKESVGIPESGGGASELREGHVPGPCLRSDFPAHAISTCPQYRGRRPFAVGDFVFWPVGPQCTGRNPHLWARAASCYFRGRVGLHVNRERPVGVEFQIFVSVPTE